MKQIERTPVPLPPSVAKLRKNGAASKPVLSEEFVDSESEPSEQKSGSSKHTTLAKTPTVARKSKITSKATSKSIEKRQAPRTPVSKPVPQSKQLQLCRPLREQSSEASSESDNDSEDSSSVLATSTPSQASRLPAPSHAVTFQPTTSYTPPRGFQAVPFNNETVSTQTSLFDRLQGKQIWHITVPADVSLKDLSSLAMNRALKGGAVLNHKGTDYSFLKVRESESIAQELLIPRQDGYRTVAAPFSQVVHLRAMAQLPRSKSPNEKQHTGPERPISITRSIVRTPQVQARGLKMRFLPNGFHGDAIGTIGSSDSESEVKQKITDARTLDKTEVLAKSNKHRGKPDEANMAKARRAKKERRRAQREQSDTSMV